MGPLTLIVLLLVLLWGLALLLRRQGLNLQGRMSKGRRLQVVEVVWFRPGSGCALIEIDQRPFVVAIGDAKAPRPLPVKPASEQAHAH
ncbi:MAG: hypothetical protein QE509_08120 [Gammaproteobacteria bacterium]|nr:hypothetical protein [Gammaproteobacteria bacterium]